MEVAAAVVIPLLERPVFKLPYDHLGFGFTFSLGLTLLFSSNFLFYFLIPSAWLSLHQLVFLSFYFTPQSLSPVEPSLSRRS